jgi:DNA recombination protein RmuC
MDMDVLLPLIGLIGLALGAWLGYVTGRRAGDARLAGLRAARDVLAAESASARAAERDALERAGLAEADVAGLRTALDYEKRAAGERLALAERGEARLSESFEALSARALDGASRRFLELAAARMGEVGERATGELESRRVAVDQMLTPLRDTLGKIEHRLGELETARTEAYAALLEQVRASQAATDAVRAQTAALVTTLRKPQARGAWGELSLRRVAEAAGMLARCDFTEQPSVAAQDATRRPDMVVHLAGGRNVVVDAKVPLLAFLEAADATDEETRTQRLRAHARHLRAHVDGLSGKAYWRLFSPTPEFVVLFVPAEAFLAPALEQDPTLLEYAAARKVMIATPTTLIAMLRTIAHAWTQEALTSRARDVFELGRELYSRLSTLGDHMERLGRSLKNAVGDYNATVGSLESRVFVPARRLAALEVVEEELRTLQPVDAGVRALSAVELAGESEPARATTHAARAGDTTTHAATTHAATTHAATTHAATTHAATADDAVDSATNGWAAEDAQPSGAAGSGFSATTAGPGSGGWPGNDVDGDGPVADSLRARPFGGETLKGKRVTDDGVDRSVGDGVAPRPVSPTTGANGQDLE